MGKDERKKCARSGIAQLAEMKSERLANWCIAALLESETLPSAERVSSREKYSFDACRCSERRSGRRRRGANGAHSFCCERDVIGAFVTTFGVRVTLAAAPRPQTVQSERALNAVLHTMLLHSARICVERGKKFSTIDGRLAIAATARFDRLSASCEHCGRTSD